MRRILALFLLAVTSLASVAISEVDRQAFLKYMASFGKTYDTTEEFLQRFHLWKQVDETLANQQNLEFTLGHNKFSDWTEAEKDLVLNRKLAKKVPLDFEVLPELEEFDLSFWDSLPLFAQNRTEDSDELFDQFDGRVLQEEEEDDFTLKSAAPMQCPQGFRWVGDKCKACPGGCASCTSDTSCRACNSRNFVYDRRRRSCSCFTGPYNPVTKDCDSCGKGKFYENGQCKSCGVENCDFCKKEGFCQQCNANFTKRQGKCTCKGFFYTAASSCVICDSDQFISAGQCKDCPQNCSTCSSPTGLCLTCSNPSFQLLNGRCSCEGSDYFVSERTGLCTKYQYCGKGFYNDGQNTCLPCKEHCKSCNAVTGFCNICDDKSMELKNDTSLSQDWHVSWEFQGQEIGQCRCGPKEAFSGGACIPLAVQCPDGAYNDGSNNCVPCPQNCTTCTDFIGFCTSCPDNTFVPELLTNNGICQCPGNQVVGILGSCENQVSCGAGFYNDGNNRCLHCYANCDVCEFKTGNCLTCSASYSLIQPQKQCACLDNQFINSNNKCETVIDCGAGKWNDGINNCMNCNSQHCNVCEKGTGICQDCMPSYRYNKDNDTCYCPYPETYWLQADNLCHDIVYPPSGKYNLGANVFTACPANCSTCHTDLYDFSGGCTVCQSTFTLNEAAKRCTCVDKQYNKNGVCTSCATNCALCADSTGSCFKCDYTGYTLQNGICSCLNGWVVQDDLVCAAKKTCSDGQYNDGKNNCFACTSTANCLKCSAATTCISCKSSYSLNAKRSGQCDCVTGTQYESGGYCYNLVNCGAYYYNNGANSCLSCRENCTYCTGYNSCTQCRSAYTLNYPSAGLCACAWNQYRYYYQHVCYGCGGGYGCGICRDPDGLCIVCKAYWTLYTANYNCYCWSPSYQSGSECYPCPDNCASCSGSTCYSCKSSFTLHYPSSYQCNCLSSQYRGNNIYCYSCPSYTYTCYDGTANAKTCYDTFSIINNRCACPTNTFLGTSVTTGMPACISLTDCPYNQYNRGDNVCLACPSNSNCLDCELTSGVPKCTQCRATFTYYANEGTYGTCRCNSGEYKTSSNACQKCGTNMITCADSTGNALSCDPTFSIINGKCVCQSHQYLSGGTCKDCPSHCLTCSSATKCLTCSTSYSVINGLCNCNTATQFYQSSTDSCVTILSPPAGYYNDGRNNMIACGPNCDKCTSGASGACTQCKATYTMTSGNCACKPYTQFESSGSCVNIIWCGNGKYNDGYNNCGACTTNCSTCLNQATNCTSCQSTFTLHYPSFGKCACGNGWYQNADGVCKQAAQNCSRAADTTGICTQCKPTFSYNSALDQCYCPSGTAWNKESDRCDDCSSGCQTCSSASFCTLCKQTYIFDQPQGSCKCNSTSLDNNGNGCQALSECPDGTYNPGDQTCEDCDPGCAKCETLTGRCLQCQSGYNLLAGYCNKWRRLEELVLEGSCHSGCHRCNAIQCLECDKGMIPMLQDKRQCVPQKKCEWPVGPIGQEGNLCLDTPFSSERVVPMFDTDDLVVDWRQWNVVRPARDQGKCGGDFAFAGAAAAEARFAIKTGKLLELSEQYLMDCAYMSDGCAGGWPESVGHLLSTKGAVLAKDYPYQGQMQECQQDKPQVFKLDYPGFRQVKSSKEAFKDALRSGPLQVAFQVPNSSFYQYTGGMLPSSFCSDKEPVNHSMLALGYGSDANSDYAIVQNQWGTDWGEAGIFRIRLTDDESGPCGLYTAYSLL